MHYLWERKFQIDLFIRLNGGFMEIIKKILSILKNINFRYEKDENKHSLDVNMDDEIKGSLSINIDDNGNPRISAKIGK